LNKLIVVELFVFAYPWLNKSFAPTIQDYIVEFVNEIVWTGVDELP
jgi:hypothetical protein